MGLVDPLPPKKGVMEGFEEVKVGGSLCLVPEPSEEAGRIMSEFLKKPHRGKNDYGRLFYQIQGCYDYGSQVWELFCEAAGYLAKNDLPTSFPVRFAGDRGKQLTFVEVAADRVLGGGDETEIILPAILLTGDAERKLEPFKQLPNKSFEQNTENRSEVLFRPLQNRENISVSYTRNLCRQLRRLRGLEDDPREKPRINVTVGATGSGKTAFSRGFYQPIMMSALGDQKPLASEAMYEKHIQSSSEAKGPKGAKPEGFYMTEFRVLMYLVITGRMIWTIPLKGVPFERKIPDLLKQANAMSRERIALEKGIDMTEAIEEIAKQFRAYPFEELVEYWRGAPMFKGVPLGAKDKKGKPFDRLERAFRILVGWENTNDAAVLGLLNEGSVCKFEHLPIIFFIDELQHSDRPYAFISRTLPTSRCVLATGAGYKEGYIAGLLDRSHVRIIPFRLGPIAKCEHIRRLLKTAPELEGIEYNEKEALMALKAAGGTPRVMVGQIRSFSATGDWAASIEDGIVPSTPAAAPFCRPAFVGLPLKKDQNVFFKGRCVQAFELEVAENFQLSPSFVHPLPSRNPERHCSLTNVHQFVGSFDERTVGDRPLFTLYNALLEMVVSGKALDLSDSTQFRRFYSKHFSPQPLPGGGLFLDWIGLAFEESCVGVWQARASSRPALWRKAKEPETWELYSAYLEESNEDFLERKATYVLEFEPETIFGLLTFPSFVKYEGYDGAWNAFFGSTSLRIRPFVNPQRLRAAWAGEGFLSTLSEPQAQIRPGDIPKFQFFFNANSAPGPDVGLFTKGFDGQEISIAFDIKLSSKQKEGSDKIFARQAVMALTCEPPPTHIVSVRSQPSEKRLRDQFDNYLKRKERLMRGVCVEHNGEHRVQIIFNPAWARVPHIVVGYECLGHLFQTAWEEVMQLRR
eukprot:gnl/Chilomastix_cuspidata/693.p1 GENE.gnl/Chilomastix_cuspidata/693~~gnl/Chilomastix_cuspidata/693.p1  ORF type:complete len:916 (-),score=64.45 gnl/Chilomastix_cuspidata/693:1389-4136(-)